MKVIEHRLDPGAFFFKCLLKIGVHVAGDCFDSVHPVHADMLNEIVDNLFLLTILDPQDMSGFQIDDMCGIPVSIVKFELINAQKPGLFLGCYEFLAIIGGVYVLETFFIDLLDDVFAQPRDF